MNKTSYRILSCVTTFILQLSGMTIGILSLLYIAKHFGSIKGMVASLVLLLGNIMIIIGDIIIIKMLKSHYGQHMVLSYIFIIHLIFGAVMGIGYVTACTLGIFL